MRAVSLLTLAACVARSTAFHLPNARVNRPYEARSHAILSVRGGAVASPTKLSSALAPISEALVSGTPIRAIGALYAIASLTVVPLTLYRQAYSFSVGKYSAIAIIFHFSYAHMISRRSASIVCSLTRHHDNYHLFHVQATGCQWQQCQWRFCTHLYSPMEIYACLQFIHRFLHS